MVFHSSWLFLYLLKNSSEDKLRKLEKKIDKVDRLFFWQSSD